MFKKSIGTVLIVAVFAFTCAIFTGVSGAENFGQVCTGLSSGKIDVSGSFKTITFTAPTGKLISRYCVKAGSINQDLGPEYVDVNPPSKTVVISHSSGKDISHYSIEYVDEETTTTSSTTSSSTTSTSSTTVPTTTTSTTTSTSSTTSTTQPVTPTTTVTSTTTIPTTTTINVTTTEPAPSIAYQTIERLASTGTNAMILFIISLVMLFIGMVAIIISKKSDGVN